ncbi:meiotic activator RIM4 [Fusarium beomiforme]|uniref:Meiotic activator RIM4 n=1 Tax=Fusarium beomiforme TaxID=44412 RepID=A0A9P5A524_9HYPO|nr:meiotic activator RIM4 [Fusarium beomiforme]
MSNPPPGGGVVTAIPTQYRTPHGAASTDRTLRNAFSALNFHYSGKDEDSELATASFTEIPPDDGMDEAMATCSIHLRVRTPWLPRGERRDSLLNPPIPGMRLRSAVDMEGHTVKASRTSGPSFNQKMEAFKQQAAGGGGSMSHGKVEVGGQVHQLARDQHGGPHRAFRISGPFSTTGRSLRWTFNQKIEAFKQKGVVDTAVEPLLSST